MSKSILFPLKNPLKGILMEDKFRDSVLRGDKSSVLREGWLDYTVGDKVLIGCPTEWCVLAKIIHVNHHSLKSVSLSDLNEEGFVNLENAVINLSKIYENISLNSQITILKWSLIDY